MKLRLQSGTITEEINLVANAPSRPYLEVKQNNNIIGYVKLNSNGNSNFTFNGMYANNLDQYIFLQHGNGIYVYDTNLVQQKLLTYNVYSGDTFYVESKETIFVISTDNNSIYKIDCNDLTMKKVMSITEPKEMFKTPDNHYWIYHKPGYNVKLSKCSSDFSVIKTFDASSGSRSYHCDSFGYIYYYDEAEYTKKINNDMSPVLSEGKTGVLMYVGNNNKVYNRSGYKLNIYDTNFKLIDSYDDPKYKSIARLFISNEEKIYLQVGPYNDLRISLYDAKTKTFVFRDKPDSLINSVSIDNDGYIYTMTMTTMTKKDRNYNTIKSINPGGNKCYKICINSDRL